MSKPNEMVGVLEELTTTTLPAKIQSMNQAGQLTRSSYMNLIRHSLNNVLIEITMGCSIEIGNDNKVKVKFNKQLPTIEDLTRTTAALTKYITDFENPVLRNISIQEAQQAGGQDMAVIPEENAQKRIMMIGNPTNKNVKNVLSQQGILGVDILDASDVMALASMGRTARKKANTTKAIIIGSAVLVIAAGTVAGVMIYNHKREQDMLNEMEMEDDIPIDEDPTDMPPVENTNIPSMSNVNIPSLSNVNIPDVDNVPQVVLE